MDIQKRNLKVDCPVCKQKIILTFNTRSCPKCGVKYEVEAVQNVFYEYESKLANSKQYQITNKIGKVANGVEKTGSFLENLGCIIFLLPVALFCLYMLLQMFSW